MSQILPLELVVPILKDLLKASGAKFTVVEREGSEVALLARDEAVKFADFLVSLASRLGGAAWRFPQAVAAYAAEVLGKRGAARIRRAEEVARDMSFYMRAEATTRGGAVYFDTSFLIRMATDILNFRFLKEGLEGEVKQLVVDMVDPGKTVVWIAARLFQRYVSHFVPRQRGDEVSLGAGFFIRIIERGLLSGWDDLTEEYMSSIELRPEGVHATSIEGTPVVFKIYRLGEFKRVAVAETPDPAPLARLLGVDGFFAASGNKVYLSEEHVDALEWLGIIPPIEIKPKE